jgi:hypothetical protein
MNPIGPQAFFASDKFPTATAAFDYGIISIHFQDGFKLARAIGVQPVNRSGHRVKGHIPHLVQWPNFYSTSKLGLSVHPSKPHCQPAAIPILRLSWETAEKKFGSRPMRNESTLVQVL